MFVKRDTYVTLPRRVRPDGAFRPRRDFGPLWFTIRYGAVLVALALLLSVRL